MAQIRTVRSISCSKYIYCRSLFSVDKKCFVRMSINDLAMALQEKNRPTLYWVISNNNFERLTWAIVVHVGGALTSSLQTWFSTRCKNKRQIFVVVLAVFISIEQGTVQTHVSSGRRNTLSRRWSCGPGGLPHEGKSDSFWQVLRPCCVGASSSACIASVCFSILKALNVIPMTICPRGPLLSVSTWSSLSRMFIGVSTVVCTENMD